MSSLYPYYDNSAEDDDDDDDYGGYCKYIYIKPGIYIPVTECIPF